MRYFRFYDISLEDEDGWFYCELSSENVIKKQVKVFGEKSFWATLYEEKDDMYMFTDQPKLNPDFFHPEDGDLEITKDEFDDIWRLSQS
jgi:hypothetical protein